MSEYTPLLATLAARGGAPMPSRLAEMYAGLERAPIGASRVGRVQPQVTNPAPGGFDPIASNIPAPLARQGVTQGQANKIEQAAFDAAMNMAMVTPQNVDRVQSALFRLFEDAEDVKAYARAQAQLARVMGWKKTAQGAAYDEAGRRARGAGFASKYYRGNDNINARVSNHGHSGAGVATNDLQIIYDPFQRELNIMSRGQLPERSLYIDELQDAVSSEEMARRAAEFLLGVYSARK